MNVSDKGNRVLSLDVVDRGRRASSWSSPRTATASAPPLSEYPVKGRGAKGVLTAKLTAKKGGLAGARVVREGQELLFISQNGMVQRTAVSGISRMGRPTQGVRVMNLKKGDRVSAVALVVESDRAERKRRFGLRRGSRGRGADASRASPTRQPPPRPPATARRR